MATTLDAQLFSVSGDGIATPKGMFAGTGTQTLAVDGALTLDHLQTLRVWFSPRTSTLLAFGGS